MIVWIFADLAPKAPKTPRNRLIRPTLVVVVVEGAIATHSVIRTLQFRQLYIQGDPATLNPGQNQPVREGAKKIPCRVRKPSLLSEGYLAAATPALTAHIAQICWGCGVGRRRYVSSHSIP